MSRQRNQLKYTLIVPEFLEGVGSMGERYDWIWKSFIARP